MSPTWTLTRKSVDDLAGNSLKTIRRKYKKAKCALKDRFAQAVAPGQERDFKSVLSDIEDSNDDISEELAFMIRIYDASDKVGKAVVLSLVARDYSK